MPAFIITKVYLNQGLATTKTDLGGEKQNKTKPDNVRANYV